MEKKPHALTSVLSSGYYKYSNYIPVVTTQREGTEEDDQVKPGLLIFLLVKNSSNTMSQHATRNLTVTIPILPNESPKPRFNAMSLRPKSLSMFPPIPPRNISAKNKVKNQNYSVMYIEADVHTTLFSQLLV